MRQLVGGAFNGDFGADVVRRHAERLGQFGVEGRGGVFQHNAVLRALRAGERGNDGGHVEFENVGEHRVRRRGIAEHALRLGIGFHQLDAGFVAAGEVQEVERDLVHREEAAGRTVFRGHVGNGGTVGQLQVIQARAEELHELADNAALAQHLRHRQHEVGGGDTFRQLAGQAEADHVRDQHGDRLAEHGSLGLDATHAPAEHGHAVDHGGVAVGAIQAVRIGVGGAADIGGPDGLRQIFQVHLMADAGAGRNDAEIVERGLAPAQEGVALAIALELNFHVLGFRIGGAGEIDHHRVVDDQIDGHQRVHFLRVAAQLGDAVAHGGEIDHAGNAGEVLHQDAARLERHFLGGAAFLQPIDNRLGVCHDVGLTVLEAQHVFQQHFQRHRQTARVPQRLRRGRNREVIVVLALNRECTAGFQAVLSD